MQPSTSLRPHLLLQAVIIGDRMDTDILAGIQSEISTVLVLSGVTAPTDVASFAYRPDIILPSVAHIVNDQPHTFYNA
jgi:NagD protein